MLIDWIIEREDMLDRLAEAIRRTDAQRCLYCGKTSCPHSFSADPAWRQDPNVEVPVYEHGDFR